MLLLAGLATAAKAESYQNLAVVMPVMSCGQLIKTDLAKAVGAAVTIKAAAETDTAKGKYCKVTGTIAPSINFEADLPMEHWTQRYAQGGCGAYCGNVSVKLERAGSCMPALNGEFAVAADDMGHQGGMGGPGSSSSQPEGAFGADPDKRIDFAYRANHETALATKALIKIFYGQPQKYAYFLGCSDGGREALVEAQRYPNDFDGISAGAPVAIVSMHNSFFHGWESAANKRADGTYILLRDRLSILHDAVLKHCQTLSGVDDGLLEDPVGCKFDSAWVECAPGAADTSKCLTAEEAAVAKKLYDGPGDGQGHLFEISGFDMGSEMDWRIASSATPQTSGGSGGGGMQTASVKYLLLPNVASDDEISRFGFTQEWFDKLEPMAHLMNAANTDLKPFEARGGKLIIWHGLSDTSVPPAISVAYYQGVQKLLGEKVTDEFLRLFLIPGVGHCGNGEGFPQIDTLSPLMAWTEMHQAPKQIIAGRISNQTAGMGFGSPGGQGQGGPGGAQQAGQGGQRQGGPGGASTPYAQADKPTTATRPVYPYPYVAHYSGKGDANDAANYEPVKVPESLPLVFNTEATKLIGPDNQLFYHSENGQLVGDKK